MVQAIIDVNERTNWLLNLIKAKYGLKTKSESIDKMAQEYEQELLEPQLRPEYVRKLQKIRKSKGKTYASAEAMFKEFEKDV